MRAPSPICVVCLHKAAERAACTAFPEGIPDAIWYTTVDHRQPFEGDGGIQFEPNPDLDPAWVADRIAFEDELRAKFPPLAKTA